MTHARLKQASDQGRLTYLLRPVHQTTTAAQQQAIRTPHPLPLQGYGVELAIKNMEYKVVDDTKIQLEDIPGDVSSLHDGKEEEDEVGGFRFAQLKRRRPELETQLAAFREEMIAADTTKEAKVWEMTNLGIQASQRIVRAADPLALMRDIAQNFPVYASALTRMKVNKTAKRALKTNPLLQYVTPGQNFVLLNGIALDAERLDVFQVYTVVEKEAMVVDALARFDLAPAHQQTLLALSFAPVARPHRAFRLRMRAPHAHIVYYNDIEKDAKYKQWPATKEALLQRGWPNQLRYARENLYTGVLVVNPATVHGMAVIERAVFFVDSNAPYRLGLAFTLSEDKAEPTWNHGLLPRDAEWDAWVATRDPSDNQEKEEDYASTIAALFHHLSQHSGSRAYAFIKAIAKAALKRNAMPSIHAVHKAFVSKLPRAERGSVDVGAILKSDVTLSYLDAMHDYTVRRGFHAHSDPHLVLNGVPKAIGRNDEFREVMMAAILAEQQTLQQLVFTKEIGMHASVDKYWNKNPLAFERHNKLILLSGDDVAFVDDAASLAQRARALSYVSGSEPGVRSTTLWCVADFSTTAGAALLSASVDVLREDARVRVAFVHRAVEGA